MPAKGPREALCRARELAEDLKRFQEGLPVLARPVSRLEHGWRWCRRNPGVAFLSATLMLMLVLGAVGGTSLAVWAFTQKTLAEGEKGKAQQAQRQAEANAGRAETNAKTPTRSGPARR